VLNLIVGKWEDLPLAEKQQLLREIIDLIILTATEIDVVLRP
jgi:hypothetical protein